MFSDGDEQPTEHDVDKKSTQLSKSEVEQLFNDDATDGGGGGEVDADEDSPELDGDASDTDTTDDDVREITKTIEELKPDDGGGGVRGKVVDMKEETVSPADGTRLTKEWTTELVQDEDVDASSGGGGGGRKSKRSSDDDVEVAAKRRAVDLLKAYIELQEAENRHLTDALNLATLAQTQRTDRYVGDEVRQLRQAVDDEAAIETLRSAIRADEDDDGDVEDDTQEQEDEDRRSDQDDVDEDYVDAPALDYVPVKREDDAGEEVFLPQTPEEDADDDRDVADEYERAMLLRERLRQYLLKEKLDAMLNEVGDEGDYDADDEWWMSKLSPAYANIYSGSILISWF